MSNLDTPDYSPDHLSQELVLKMESQKVKILRDIAELLECGGIEDEVDREIVVGATEFIENPSEELSEIMSQTVNIGAVLAGYDMQGVNFPPQIDAMQGYLFALQCINIIKFVEEALMQGSSDFSKIQKAMSRGADWAITLSKWYNDDTFLSAFNELQERF